jgi:hypothetical protein
MTIKLQDIQNQESGAKFLNADLHVHSFGGSADVTDPDMTVANIIDYAHISGISILAITDHNSDLNTKASIDYALQYSEKLLMMAGAEITTSNGHLLAYFSSDQTEALRDLLGSIKIIGKPGQRDSHTAMSMASVIHEVEKLGGIAIAAHIDRPKTGFEKIVPGYPSWKKDILTASGLYGLEFDDASHLTWYSADDELTPDGSERKKLLNSRGANSVTAARQHLAAMQNSDAHSLADLQATGDLTRIKIDELSFEAFRTALVDPGARVRATATVPTSIPKVLGMHFIGGFLAGETIQFSSNLNCLIGGRGTGKSTAVQSLAYGLGVREGLDGQDNCADEIVIYAQDANGVLYRYERPRGGDPSVQAKEDQSIKNVPADAFRIEFFGQGDLSEVAKDPLKNPALLQEFLDRHIATQDLRGSESELLKALSHNGSQIIPLAGLASQIPGKKVALKNLDAKLKIAETGKVREIAAFKTRLAAERALAEELVQVANFYEAGLSLSNFIKDYDMLAASAGTLTGDDQSLESLRAAEASIEAANAFLLAQESRINQQLRKHGEALRAAAASLKDRHKAFDKEIATKSADLRQKGLSGGVEELNTLIKQRTVLAAEIARIESRGPELKKLQEVRATLLTDLQATRDAIVDRRKSQLAAINKNLASTIRDYAVHLFYDPAGIIDDFWALVMDVMHGTYFQDETGAAFCGCIDPQQLVSIVTSGQYETLASVGSIDSAWASQIIQRFVPLDKLHKLETVWKPPVPVIKVTTKGGKPRQIGVNQLSDGQKHTILLAIAMLAESNVPLVIDQPEDDLDNAFIFDSVVTTLRTIKERRQVIVVTHNANIAVLGDSELILPMKRSGENSHVMDRGSIDRSPTKKAVQEILEGGELAFRRRREIYGH